MLAEKFVRPFVARPYSKYSVVAKAPGFTSASSVAAVVVILVAPVVNTYGAKVSRWNVTFTA